MNSKEAIISFLNLFEYVTITLSIIRFKKIPKRHKQDGIYKLYNPDNAFPELIYIKDFIYEVVAESHDDKAFLNIEEAVDYFIRLSKV